MMRFKPVTVVLPLIALLVAANIAYGSQIRVPFEEIAQDADLIFIGTVASQNGRFNPQGMIVTDVLFKDILVVHAKDQALQKDSPVVQLAYAGGRVGDRAVQVSDSPTFTDGHRYLIFMYDDGKLYANPIIGSFQGMFEVIKDRISQAEYVLTAGGRAVVEASAQGLRVSEQQVAYISNGIISGTAGSSDNRRYPQLPTSADTADTASSQGVQPAASSKPLTLQKFLDHIKNTALKLPIKQKMLIRDGQGHLYVNNGGKMDVAELRLSRPTASPFANIPEASASEASPALPPFAAQPKSISAVNGGVLGACGYHNLFLVMEQMPTSSWTFQINNDCMFTWNQFMDVYRYIADDGTFGANGVNEFGGFAPDADLAAIYGFHWGSSALAVTISFMGGGEPQCGRISESDLFWNPARSWTDDAEFAIGNSNVVLLRSVNMHELGHTWGEQLGAYPETYDYDVATVMHAYYYNIVEDGWGVHSNDAYLIRRIYDDQRGILSTKDIGVESYHASNGLINSTTNALTYYPGDSITLNNVLVENMSYSAVSDLRIRFYLSTNRIISTGDYQMGSYWFWTSFIAEGYNVGNYTTTIPSTLPPGTYYVGAIVTLNGFANDDYTYNNTTSFYRAINVIPRPDSTSPTVTITSPTSNPTYSTGVNSLTLGGSASDNIGVTQVSWSNNRGGSGTATGTSNWTASGISLQSGANILTVTAQDAAGNTGTDTLTVTYTPATIQIVVQTNPAGRSFTVDGTTYATTQTFNWTSGSSHTIATTSPQSGGTGARYVWSNWSDGGGISHSVAPTGNTTYTANFTAQYFLTMNAGSGGSVSPASNWFNSGQNLTITATPSSGFSFASWTGSGSGSYSGTSNPASVVLNGPVTQTANFNASTGHTTPFDFDADDKGDLAVWRPSNGVWYVINSSTGGNISQGWGVSTDVPAPADYDGDGKTDIAVWRPSTGQWYIINSSNGTVQSPGWGVNGDKPVPADYDGDGKADIAVYRPSNGTWYIINSSTGGSTSRGWGVSTDVPVPADYDGDGKADIAIWRPSTGQWYIINSSNGAVQSPGWGVNGDKPVPADYDGDGKADIAAWRPSNGTWYIINSSNGTSSAQLWGVSTDKPVPTDYDGDGKADIAAWRPSNGVWYIINSSTGAVRTQSWGINGDMAIPTAFIR